MWSIYVKIESLNGLTLNIIAKEQPLEDVMLRGGSQPIIKPCAKVPSQNESPDRRLNESRINVTKSNVRC